MACTNVTSCHYDCLVAEHVPLEAKNFHHRTCFSQQERVGMTTSCPKTYGDDNDDDDDGAMTSRSCQLQIKRVCQCIHIRGYGVERNTQRDR